MSSQSTSYPNPNLIIGQQESQDLMMDYRFTNVSHENLKSVSTSNTSERQEQSRAVICTLAHEVRNPLQNIYLALGHLESEGADDNLRMCLEIINRSTDRVNALITDMLNTFVVKKEPRCSHAINRLLDEALEMAIDRITLRMIHVEKFYEHEICQVMVNDKETKIALVNIIINAIEAMTPAKGELKITTSLNDGKCMVTIGDNGAGISRTNLKKIFVPFYTSKAKGIGLGLSSTLHILQSQQATVKVESEEGKGTRFIISFLLDQ